MSESPNYKLIETKKLVQVPEITDLIIQIEEINEDKIFEKVALKMHKNWPDEILDLKIKQEIDEKVKTLFYDLYHEGRFEDWEDKFEEIATNLPKTSKSWAITNYISEFAILLQTEYLKYNTQICKYINKTKNLSNI
jgi:hypothetical protein